MREIKSALKMFIITSFAMGCGSNYKKPESIQAKMDRYNANLKGQNQVPTLKVANVSEGSLRSPASIKKEKLKHSTGSKETNKRLYFLTLYTQYLNIKNYTESETQTIKSCPSFHSSLVTHKEKFEENTTKNKKLKSYNNLNFNDKNIAASYPELLLPITRDATVPTVLDIIKSENTKVTPTKLVQAALNLHNKKTYDELVELCEYGASDNYYVWENLNTYVKNHALAPSAKSIKILFRTTIFANEAIYKSLDVTGPKGRTPASNTKMNPYMTEVMGRLGVPWAQNYFKDWTSKRESR